MNSTALLSRGAAVLAVCSVAFGRADAQCPDGSAAVNGLCRSAATTAVAAPKPIPIDPNRVVVLPFRVTTVDSLLGEGFAELLAQEFTGEGGPRAVDMSSVLSSWRRAGGGLRAPLPLESAMQLARRLGGGILLQGQIASLGGRLNISASMINSSTAMPIGPTARIAGPNDSIEVLLRQVAATLLGAGASDRTLRSARLSQNPAALRSYLEGLAHWRQGRWDAASAAFEASIRADSTFASALYQRWLFAAASAGGGAWVPRVRSVKDLLTPRERDVFDASAGTGQIRSRTEAFQARRAAAERLGDSPEAWYLVGDYVYHDGHAIVGVDSALSMARDFFSLAVALDSQPVFVFHLTEIAISTHDTALARRLLPAYERIEGEERWARSWALASMLNDTQLLDRLRRAGPPKDAGALSAFALMSAANSSIPTPLLVEGLQRVAAPIARIEGVELSSRYALRVVNLVRGRPAAAESQFDGDAPISVAINPSLLLSGDPVDSIALKRARVPTVDSAQERRRQCHLARARMQAGARIDPDSVNTTAGCRNVLRTWIGFNEGTLSDSALARFDTLVTYRRFSTFLGFENRLLAGMYESKGNTAAALRAIRMYPRDYPGPWLPTTLREEGRLYLAVGDTINALRSYQRFLDHRVDAQPPHVAERDSIKALVSRLKQRVVP